MHLRLELPPTLMWIISAVIPLNQTRPTNLTLCLTALNGLLLMESLNRRRYGGGLSEVPEHTIEFIFNQTGEGDIVTPLVDTGLLDYLVENIKAYQGKYQEDGSMVVTELVLETGNIYGNPTIYDRTPTKYKYKDEKINYDCFIKFPTIYYKVSEIEPDIYKIKFSASPFENCLKVFGNDILIWNYTNDIGNCTLSQAEETIINKGQGYYCYTSDEMGVLAFLNIFANGINNDVIRTQSQFLGIVSNITSGMGRNYYPNVKIDNLVAEITHNDGEVEYLQVPYLWSQSYNKLHITKYLNIIPKEVGEGIYKVGDKCWINNNGIGFYYLDTDYWGISGDKGANDKMNFRCRLCFKGKIVETEDVEWFKSLPIIN